MLCLIMVIFAVATSQRWVPCKGTWQTTADVPALHDLKQGNDACDGLHARVFDSIAGFGLNSTACSTNEIESFRQALSKQAFCRSTALAVTGRVQY